MDEEKRLLKEYLDKIVGKRVIGYRYGDGGFDLIFDDGSELEVYACVPNSIKKRDDVDCYDICEWGIIVDERKLFPVSSCKEANEVVDEVLSKTRVHDIDVAGTINGFYVTVAKRELETLKKECTNLSDKARRVLCQ